MNGPEIFTAICGSGITGLLIGLIAGYFAFKGEGP